jgi:lipid-binding SYLF domain-containing protein
MQGEIYSYSRSKGAFAGISLKGTVINSDEEANFDYYGRFFKTKDILIDERVKNIPESGKQFIGRLNFLVSPKKNK